MEHYQQLKKGYVETLNKELILKGIHSALNDGADLQLLAVQGGDYSKTVRIEYPYLEEFVDLIESTFTKMECRTKQLEGKLLAVEEFLKI